MKLPRLYIKKLDWFIIKSFVQLLMGTFFICLFIFIMQMLWKSVDEFVGKGLDFTVLAQFFSLCSVAVVAEALPLAILLASLMTFGNFGERLELLAMKAAGIPLIRIMMPIMAVCIIMGGVSFYFQNVVSPYAQMKLYTILYSIKQTSPEVEIPEGVFYDQIEGYNLFVQKKDKETGMLYKVMIYDMSAGFENANILVADSGKITTTPDDKHLILQLFTGEQFSNIVDQGVNKKNVPYRRETFRKKVVVIPIDGGFDMKDGSFLKANAKSQNMLELEESIESLTHYTDSIGRNNWRGAMRTTFNIRTEYTSQDTTFMERNNLFSLNTDSVYNTATSLNKKLWKKAHLTKIKQLKTDYEIKNSIIYGLDKDLNKHKITWWDKITLSLACVIFFFIGAPLGAIVRKGGLGYPVLISVAIFILYYLLNTSAYKMARAGEWHIWVGSWLSTLVLAPMGILFTYQSNKDSAIFNTDAYKAFFMSLFGIREKRNVTLKEVVIDDPDYNNDYKILEEIHQEAREYKKRNKLKKLPSISSVFFTTDDNKLLSLNEKLENTIEEMGNSRNKKVIQLLNLFPILAPEGIKSPFTIKWLNILSLVIFPIGIIIYVRAVRFRFRLLKDLVTVEQNSKTLMERIVKEKLI
ncbi:MAG: LptF/LptG family permease [Bacteroidaceae bacterium]|nr:LptF/LptG family permease [Bacteroidaceae bacterium]